MEQSLTALDGTPVKPADETINLILSNPVNIALGTPNPSVLNLHEWFLKAAQIHDGWAASRFLFASIK